MNRQEQDPTEAAGSTTGDAQARLDKAETRRDPQTSCADSQVGASLLCVSGAG